MTDPSEDLTPSLVLGLRAGDDAAARMLEALYRGRLARFAQGYLGDADLAEDAVQEVFAKVLVADSVPDSFRAWIYRIARNHCLNLRRARGRGVDEAPLATDLELAASVTGDLSRLAREDDRRELLRTLESLSEGHREVLRLRYAEDLSREEISAVLDQPVSVVKSRLYEGMQALRSRLGA